MTRRRRFWTGGSPLHEASLRSHHHLLSIDLFPLVPPSSGRSAQTDAISFSALSALAEYRDSLLPLAPWLDHEQYLYPGEVEKRCLQRYVKATEELASKRDALERVESNVEATALEFVMLWKEVKVEREARA